jgi:signal transduction histidine kinase
VETASLGVSDSIRLFLEQGLLPFLVLGLVGLAAMLLALPVLTSGLRRVAADAGSIRPENPAIRMNEAGVPRELLPVVRGFNAALDRLTGELDRRRRFIADAAHELKTPLAIVSLQVEALQEQPRKPDLQRMVARLSELVAQMLDVERLSINGARRCELDLSMLAADVIADMTPMALACGYELSLDAPASPVRVDGDSQALTRAIANLLGNAVSHGGGGGQIRVVIAPEGTLDVLNGGPGVPRSLRAVLFEPFSRGRWDRDGCGLGLHLTREIMRGHGGEALLLDTEEGAAFRLRFPARIAQEGDVGQAGATAAPIGRGRTDCGKEPPMHSRGSLHPPSVKEPLIR